jgi:hypothetical protein
MIIAVAHPLSSRAFIGGSVEVQRTFARGRQRYNTGYVVAKTCPSVSYKMKRSIIVPTPQRPGIVAA